MSIVVPTASRNTFLKYMLNYSASENQTLKLYSNNYTPVVGSVAGDFTETTGGGYTSKSLTGSSWSVATAYTDDAEATYATQTWTFTGAVGGTGIVYGYYTVGASSGLLLWADRFSSSFTPTNNGDQIAFAPKLRLGDLG